ncbi:hypothetical protein TRIATDRAFT_257923 [Trichoderma atroviride IMI 206040]|uniref:Uncharacterized protein n=1 Tax=Hypocrea atroviridis (strain ATCC 20476 / IMI 206040) TaxID=452589 RepID=G9NY28_HYPAI|nr:uncharacterized protein TRIATDRAFT_257923 [Trichoderma atroviride IMI 206040]EHK44356.1 hypothetical protein TRIATDRAFT_257923 [Trichoderma atroviride IMI 206040]
MKTLPTVPSVGGSDSTTAAARYYRRHCLTRSSAILKRLDVYRQKVEDGTRLPRGTREDIW